MARLFGTDGVRGIAGEDLTTDLAMRIGRGAAAVLGKSGRRTKFIIGKDTRISGDMLETALAAGLCSVGADVLLAGVIPTPAIAYLARLYGCTAGVVISASHNPVEFNGIKLFDGEGYKLPDAVEDEIEFYTHPENEGPHATNEDVGRITTAPNAIEDYVAYLKGKITTPLNSIKVAVDCANGAASETARLLLPALGAQCHFINAKPNGVNINKNCGSTHIDQLAAYVVENGLDCGVAFDGDADRCLAVDENGKQLDGDKMIAIFAQHMENAGVLKKKMAVVTVMSNLGFITYMENKGFTTTMTAVGDRYVLEEMKSGGYNLGGEQSGHITLLDYNTTGDGQMTAALLLAALAESGKKMSELNAIYENYPQVLLNVHTTPEGKAKFKEDEIMAGFIETQQQKLIGKGRVLVRPSGTEPLLRVMVEGTDFEDITECANRIAEKMKERLG